MANKILTIILAAIMLLSFSACMYDGPPKDDTPNPPALDGVFVSGGSSFTFNGDGKTIAVNMDSELAELTGLPEGENKGEYVFLLYNGSYRYDKAEDFRIIIGENEYLFFNTLGMTDSDTVAFRCYDGNSTNVIFEKEALSDSNS